MEEDSGIHLKSLKVDGGASANDFLMQFQSDILNTEVKRPRIIETTALGAAYLAGLATGYWKSGTEIRENWVLGKSFMPDMPEDRRKELAKDVKKKGDGAKVAIRNIRRDANEAFKKMEKNDEISEDELKDLTEKVQKLTDKAIEKIDKAVENKTKEVLTV